MVRGEVRWGGGYGQQTGRGIQSAIRGEVVTVSNLVGGVDGYSPQTGGWGWGYCQQSVGGGGCYSQQYGGGGGRRIQSAKLIGVVQLL